MLKTGTAGAIIVSAEIRNDRRRQEKMMNRIPRDPVILLSYVNTQLRDNYHSLDEMCQALGVDPHGIISALAGIGYTYEPAGNCFH